MCHNVEFDERYKGYQIVGLWVQDSHRCGYVRIPKSHKYFGVGYDDVENKDGNCIDCHGGLTFGKASNSYPVATHVKAHWIGFDCAHLGDRSHGNSYPDDVMREEWYVLQECKRIVDQLIEVQ